MAGAEITLFAKSGGPLTKKISLDSNGGISSDASHCFMTCGAASRTTIEDVNELGALMHDMLNNNALALGSLRAGLPNQVNIVTKHSLNGTTPLDTVARTKETLVYRSGACGFVLLDFDTKGMPAAVADRLNALGGFVPAIASMIPEVSRAARLLRASTSAGLYREDTHEALAGSRGLHVYLGVADVSDSDRFLKTLHARCWLNGLGWFMVGVAGQLLERSVVDRMVGTPERLVFEGPPVLVPPLMQDQGAREPCINEGGWLDTTAVCPPLSTVEKSRLGEYHAKAAHALDREIDSARNRFLDEQTRTIAQRCGINRRRRARRPGSVRGRDAGRPVGGRELRPLQGQDHAPGRRHAVDSLVCARPHHLPTQARRCRGARDPERRVTARRHQHADQPSPYGRSRRRRD